MRAEAEQNISARVAVTALERILTLVVYVAINALLLWFILFAGPPFPAQLTDRGVRWHTVSLPGRTPTMRSGHPYFCLFSRPRAIRRARLAIADCTIWATTACIELSSSAAQTRSLRHSALVSVSRIILDDGADLADMAYSAYHVDWYRPRRSLPASAPRPRPGSGPGNRNRHRPDGARR